MDTPYPPRGLVWIVAALLALLAPSSASAAELLPADTPPHEAIDHYIDARLTARGIPPAPQADDANLLRRLALDLIGRPAIAAEVAAFHTADEATRRAEWVDRWLASPAFVRHQAQEFDTQLMYGAGRSVKKYLERALRENRGWDRIFRDLLLVEPTDEDTADASEFLKSRVADLDKLTTEVSTLFLGVNVSCAQCHDHPYVSDWTQDHFYGMKSFFARTFENGGFLGERDYGQVEYQTVDGEKRQAQLMFISGVVLDEPAEPPRTDADKKREKDLLEQLKKDKAAPPAPEYSRRQAFVDVVLREEERHYLARSLVNQLWKRYFGYGLVEPIDQMHAENPASHPELLDWLARDFIDHGYDLRRLTRGIVMSQAYSRSSQYSGSEPPLPSTFGVAQVRPLAPQQYAVALRLASTDPGSLPDDVFGVEFDKRMEEIDTAARSFAGSFEQPRDDFQVSAGEALLVSNGDRFRNDFLRESGAGLVGALLKLDDNRAAAALAVETICGRPADDEELSILTDYLTARGDRRPDALKQLVWALLASAEVRFNY